ncbi:terminase small subunit protein [Sphingomonas sp. gentR]|uniref:terminase small subunit-like protein n=1 Tax=Sphingomonas sp. gentR TaxID=3118768 RepID=UPI0030CD8C89
MGDRICELLAEGQSLRAICAAEDMPSQSAVFRWLADENRATFRQQYARAREAQADALFDEMLDIADDGSNDWMERRRQDGSTDEVLNSEHVQRSKLRIDARKWMASKLNPKVYGDKLDVTSGNEPLRNLDDDALDARIAAKLKSLG